MTDLEAGLESEEPDGVGDFKPGEPFFFNKKAAAVLKHGILTRYLPPFISKVGSVSADHAVVVLDGYAGPGRYDDGTDGSPALLARSAGSVSSFRKVDCHFVEQKRTSYRKLKAFLESDEAAALTATPYYGDVQDHMPTILAAAQGLPLFAYLDPFGFGIPFDDVVALLRRHPGGQPPTEVLLNFTANGIRRAGGLLNAGRVISPTEEKTLQRSDAACGSDWWRDVVRSRPVLEEAVEAVAKEYMRRVCTAAGTVGFAVDVKNREHHKPIYYLIFFTRHPDGMWLFNQAVSGASKDWREHLAPAPWKANESLLFDIRTERTFEEEEAERAEAWVEQIKANIVELLAAGPFVVGRKISRVYGTTLGEAREMHVRAAIKALHKEQRTPSTGVGDVSKMLLQPMP